MNPLVRLGKRGRITIAVIVFVVTLFIVADYVVSSPAVCGSCHEMQSRTETWEQSAHAEVECVECHVEPRPWYEGVQQTGAKGGLLLRDSVDHMRGGYQNPVEKRRAGTPQMADEVCLKCHDPNRKATSGFRITINHGEHARRNKACVSCHVRTAHPKPSRGKALSLMAQCYTCHGQEEYPKATTECAACHPADFELLPTSHKPAKWKRGHSDVALADPKQCTMCHEKSFCNDCHGVEMPHPATWTQGEKGHSRIAKQKRATCAKCHEEKPDLCSMCHHKSYDPSKGNWVKQHFIEVEQKGAAFCFECHSPLFCPRCHVRPNPQG